MPILGRAEYWDKVYACWLGKNCGGTLGAPLEKAFAQDEPFSIDWYPELREGGIPNDDLEMQLIWLKAVEERGFDLTSRDLAQYWLDHIGYNWDEYGLNKTNLRLGLTPPVSGYYNNWFRDCMGSPIRSEIWACLAPGAPDLAVRYAYEDASVDHAGGEGVWGELFNAAVESAAFVEHDPHTLLEIGLSYIPTTCKTAQAVQAARAAHAAGVEWQEARRRVRAATPHYNAQYAPPNIGFQVIGWLYGRDFGDAICTAVNCGYDTDCTGATLGALLGIIGGRAGLPERWTAPLGEGISTNESWGGLHHASTGYNPVPTTLTNLTDRVCALGPRLLALRGRVLQVGEHTDLRGLNHATLHASEETAAWREAIMNPLRLTHRLNALTIELDYGQAPVVVPGSDQRLVVVAHNPHDDALTLETELTAPAGWTARPTGRFTTTVPPHGHVELRYVAHAAAPAHVGNSNTVMLVAQPRGRPAEPATPIVLVGARRWQVWGPYNAAGDADALLDAPLAPEEGLGQIAQEEAHAGGWRIVAGLDNALPLDDDWIGVTYARLFLWSAEAREVRLGVPATCPRRLWLNGQAVHEARQRGPLRPNYGGDHVSYADTALRQGWNEVVIKYTRDAQCPPFDAHFMLSSTGLFHGLWDVGWTRLPWEWQPGEGE